jgi:hypothetical protein
MPGTFLIVPGHVGIRDLGVQSPTVLKSAEERTGRGLRVREDKVGKRHVT